MKLPDMTTDEVDVMLDLLVDFKNRGKLPIADRRAAVLLFLRSVAGAHELNYEQRSGCVVRGCLLDCAGAVSVQLYGSEGAAGSEHYKSCYNGLIQLEFLGFEWSGLLRIFLLLQLKLFTLLQGPPPAGLLLQRQSFGIAAEPSSAKTLPAGLSGNFSHLGYLFEPQTQKINSPIQLWGSSCGF
ncbi:unnamed protein product [Ilex paraguariensis]|uniref:Uncharacterized protein n=1 Tax=Ilex paraguariensis TaxID=185542 RepID=A0ABC8UNI0_9AQUA